MRSIRCGIGLPALIALLTSSPAQAQVFAPSVNPFSRPQQGKPPRWERWRVAAYAVLWDYPSRAGGGGQAESDYDPGALITGDYFLTKNLSLGGYWNRFTGEVRLTGASVDPALRGQTVADAAGTAWDAHATYYPSGKTARGWSIQVGYTTLKNDFHYNQQLLPLPPQHESRQGLGIWLNGSRAIGARSFAGSRRPIALFGSVGYYTSNLGAANAILGGSLPITRRLSLSASVWRNASRTRTTFGLSGSF